MTKKDRIEQILKELSKLLDIVADNKKSIAISLIDRAAFMQASAEELEDYINEFGYTEEYQNGPNQSGKKKSSEAEVYLSIIQRYAQTMSQLVALLPECEEKKEVSGSLLNFVGNNPRTRTKK